MRLRHTPGNEFPSIKQSAFVSPAQPGNIAGGGLYASEANKYILPGVAAGLVRAIFPTKKARVGRGEPLAVAERKRRA